MPYIGNNIRSADDYRLIDDISSGFNGSAKTFALQVAGSAPVPFPKTPQQCLISVNGVIQEPDPTGNSGFTLTGTNIVFSSAPTGGHSFFGIIYATADYLNAGGTFPDGAVGAPSITFTNDDDTGLYKKGSGSIGFVSNSTEIANTDSNGITISSGNLILGDSSGASSDRILLGAGSDLQIYHDGSNSYIDDTGTGNIFIRGDSTLFIRGASNQDKAKFTTGGSVELYFDNSKKFQTTSIGCGVTGNLTFADNGKAIFGTGDDLEIFHDGSTSRIHSPSHNLNVRTPRFAAFNGAGTEDMLKAVENGAVELYHDNSKKFETTSSGVTISGGTVANGHITLPDHTGSQDGKLRFGAGTDLEIYHDGSNSFVLNTGGQLLIRSSTALQLGAPSGEIYLAGVENGAVELYHDNSKKFQTTSDGAAVTNISNNNGLDLNGVGNNTCIRFTSTGSSPGHAYRINYHSVTNNIFNSPCISFDKTATNGNFDSHIGAISDGGFHLADNKKLHLGGTSANGDLQIFHDGSNSIINESGTGQLLLQVNGSLKFNTQGGGVQFYGSLYGDDNNKIELGNDQDLQIFHSGSASFIKSPSHNLFIQSNVIDIGNSAGNEAKAKFIDNGAVELYHDGSKKLHTDSFGVIVSGGLALDGDNLELRIGNSQDLKIFHDGTNSFLTNNTNQFTIRNATADADLFIKADDVRIWNSAGNEQYITADRNDAVLLFFDNSKKAETSSAGFKVTGACFVNDGSATGNRFSVGNGGDLKIFHTNPNSFIQDTSSRLVISSNVVDISDTDGDKMAEFTENSSAKLFHNGSQKLNTSSTGITVTGTVVETSDIALKSNIQPLTNTLEKLQQITGCKYNLINSISPSMGVIAQDVEKVFPELVHGSEGNKTLQYSGLIGVLVEAVKDLSAKVAALEAA